MKKTISILFILCSSICFGQINLATTLRQDTIIKVLRQIRSGQTGTATTSSSVSVVNQPSVSITNKNLATSSLQNTGNSTLVNIQANLTTLNSATSSFGSSANANASTQISRLNNIIDVNTSTGTNLGATTADILDGIFEIMNVPAGQPVFVNNPITGFATSANQSIIQTTLSTISSQLGTLNSKLPNQGANTRANSQPVTMASDQPAISVTYTSSVPQGTNTIGSIVGITNSVIPGISASALGKAEDNIAANADVGVSFLAVRYENIISNTSQTGDYSNISVDDLGKIIVQPYAPLVQQTQGIVQNIATNTATVIIPATASVRNYITTITVINEGVAGTVIEILDGSNVIYKDIVVGSMGRSSSTFSTPLKGSINTAISVRCQTAGGNVSFTITGFKAL